MWHDNSNYNSNSNNGSNNKAKIWIETSYVFGIHKVKVLYKISEYFGSTS